MRTEREFDPLMEWGHQAAVIVFVIALFGAMALVLAGAVSGGHSRNLDALLAVAGGGLLGYGIIWLRKRRERATRPSWMGTTTDWKNNFSVFAPQRFTLHGAPNEAVMAGLAPMGAVFMAPAAGFSR